MILKVGISGNDSQHLRIPRPCYSSGKQQTAPFMERVSHCPKPEGVRVSWSFVRECGEDGAWHQQGNWCRVSTDAALHCCGEEFPIYWSIYSMFELLLTFPIFLLSLFLQSSYFSFKSPIKESLGLCFPPPPPYSFSILQCLSVRGEITIRRLSSVNHSNGGGRGREKEDKRVNDLWWWRRRS